MAGGVAWLLDSYERASHEEKYSGKRLAGPERRVMLALCKESCIAHTMLVLAETECFDPTYSPVPDT